MLFVNYIDILHTYGFVKIALNLVYLNPTKSQRSKLIKKFDFYPLEKIRLKKVASKKIKNVL